MFTQCPKCRSVFMVSDKDIRAHEGLVRCGNCYSVFNSSWNLTDDPRSEIVEKPVTDGTSLAAGQVSGFTFSILDNDGDELATDENVSDQSEDLTESVIKDNKSNDEGSDHNVDDYLEPFPEPEKEDDLQTVPLAAEADKKDHDSLLYFDSGDDEEDETAAEAHIKTVAIEDTSIMQMPSLIKNGKFLDLDEPLLEPDVSETESTMMSMTEDSMWPGGEVSFEDTEGDFNLPVLDDEISEAKSKILSISDAAEMLPGLPDILIDEHHNENDLVEGLSDPVHFNEIAGIDDGSLPETKEEAVVDEGLADEEFSAQETRPVEPFFPSLEDEDEIAEIEQDDISGDKVITGDAIISDRQDAEEDERIPVESLAESADDALTLDNDEEDESVDDSVFIISEEEDLDDAYIPISVKNDDRDELFQDLDDFPEPGELSKLNYEETMEINAMLEAANISKEQLDSALSSSDADDDNAVEEIMLSSDAGTDLSEAIFISQEDDEKSGVDSASKKKTKSGRSFVKNLLPLGWGVKKSLTEPLVLDPDETQLIQNLNRGKNKTVAPEWITQYSLIAASVLLVLTLMGQIGYFYMDKLVRITPIRPLLEVGCKVAGCSVPSIQNTEDIKQLSSRLTPLAGGNGGFKVDSILVNRGIRSQDFPALELTLTDRAGNMISRRVVAPEKYLPAGQSKEMKPNEAVDVSIRFRTPSIRVDGFELRPVSRNWLERI